ncbi:MAG: thermopsin, partial [Thermoplasmata archaeon]|nr:thermopsin [Thermoplasmata archaeon]
MVLASVYAAVATAGSHTPAPTPVAASGHAARAASHPVAFLPRQVRHAPPLTAAHAVNTSSAYRTEPAPMGVADYGIDDFGFPYQYQTQDFAGSVTVNSLQAFDASTGDPTVSFQLNANFALCQTFCFEGSQYDFWLQSIAVYNTSANTIDMVDNIWNLSSTTASIFGSTLSGFGIIAPFMNTSFYGFDSCADGAPYGEDGSLGGFCESLAPPMSFNMYLSVFDFQGVPTVWFGFDDGQGFHHFDIVSFPWASGFQEATMLVDGFNYNPANLFYDTEFIVGGDNTGASTTASAADMLFFLTCTNGYNWQATPDTYNFGSDTAETINNIVATHENGGFLYGWYLTAGRGLLAKPISRTLWGQLILEANLSYGSMFAYYVGPVADPRRESAVSGRSSVGQVTGFRGGRVLLDLPIGNYTFQVTQGSLV